MGSRGWIWAVVALVLVLVVGAPLALVFHVRAKEAAISQSEPFRLAVERTRANPLLKELGGVPEVGLIFISVAASQSYVKEHEAAFVLRFSGEQRSATVYARADRPADQWVFSRLALVYDGTRNENDLR